MLLFQSLRMLITLACPNNCCAVVHVRTRTWQHSRNVLKILHVALLEAAKRGKELQMCVMAPPLTQQR